MSTSPTCRVASSDSTTERRGSLGDLLAVPRGSVRCTVQSALVAFCEAGQVDGLAVYRDGTYGGGYDWPADLTFDRVADAIVQTLADARFDHLLTVERDDAGAVTLLRWEGCFTPGRLVEVRPDASGAVLRWNTATGAPSRYIGRALEAAGLATVPDHDVARVATSLTPGQHGRLAALIARD